jgi:hypothetical protein
MRQFPLGCCIDASPAGLGAAIFKLDEGIDELEAKITWRLALHSKLIADLESAQKETSEAIIDHGNRLCSAEDKLRFLDACRIVTNDRIRSIEDHLRLPKFPGCCPLRHEKS